MCQCLETFLVSQLHGNVAGIWWVEAGAAAEYPVVYRIFPHDKNHFAPNVSSAKVEKLCSR